MRRRDRYFNIKSIVTAMLALPGVIIDALLLMRDRVSARTL